MTTHSITNTLIENNKSAYLNATQHPFLKQLGSAQINPAALEKFLNQDRIFALGYCKWLSAIGGRIPILERSDSAEMVDSEDVKLLNLISFAVSNGLREVDMFPNTLTSLNLQFTEVEASETCYAYIRYLYSLRDNDEALVALWALEKIYLDGWSYAKSKDAATSSPSPYTELLDNWTCPLFVNFVDSDLKYQVERLKGGTDKLNDIFSQICQHEISFFQQCLQ